MSARHGGRREGAGRPKGSIAKFNADLKLLILGALEDVGGREYLAKQAVETPAAFMMLLGKVLPTQLAGDPANPVSFVIRAPAAVTSTEEWLRQYAPKTINGEVETEVEDAAPPARPSPLAAPVEPVAQPSTSPTTTVWLDTHGPKRDYDG